MKLRSKLSLHIMVLSVLLFVGIAVLASVSTHALTVWFAVFSAAGLLLIFFQSWFYSSYLQRVTAEEERIANELLIAGNIQAGVLPKALQTDVAAYLRPGRGVGGDIYDVVEKDGKVCFIVGDASGKGVSAALFSFMVGVAFRLGCDQGNDPDEIIRNVNALLSKENDLCMFITAFVGILDRATRVLSFCNAGHTPPAVISPSGTVEFLKVRRSPPVAVCPDHPYVGQSVTLEAGSRLLVYTDGVTEAEQADHRQYGEARLKDLAARQAKKEVKVLVDALRTDVDCFTAGAEQSDDITILAIGC